MRGKDKVLTRCLRKVIELMEADGGNILILEDGILRMKVYEGMSKEFYGSFRELSPEEGTSSMVLKSGKPLAIGIEDYPTPRFLPALQKEGVKSIASVLLSSKGKILGVLHLTSRKRRHFSEESSLVGRGDPIRKDGEESGLFLR